MLNLHATTSVEDVFPIRPISNEMRRKESHVELPEHLLKNRHTFVSSNVQMSKQNLYLGEMFGVNVTSEIVSVMWPLCI